MPTFLARLAVNVRQEEDAAALRPAPPWRGADASDEARGARIGGCLQDDPSAAFWFFDATYFPPEVYTQGYAAPAPYHRHLVAECFVPGVYVHLGARDHGKTVTAKKWLAFMLLSGRVSIAGTFSQKLDVSRALLADVRALLEENPRIVSDWRPRFTVANADALQMTTEGPACPRPWRFARAFSEGRSVRGYARQFGRPDVILCDDLENRKSPLGADQVTRRGKLLAETRTSMQRGGTLVVLGNDFDPRCLMHRLRTDHEEGRLDPSWRVERHAAWRVPTDDAPDGGPLWPDRFPATSLLDLRTMLAPADEDEWQGEYLQQPQPPEGNLFRRDPYREGHAPSDVRSVVYVDPNLAIKGKGDTTGMVAIGFSPSTNEYYVTGARCRSYSDSNDLLGDALELRTASKARTIGFDGHVTQESTWTQHVRGFVRERQMPYPVIEWCRYRTDDLAKNAATAWSEGRIVFPVGFAKTDEGARFLSQVFAFRGKRAPSETNDDAPDALICGFELLHERGYARPRGQAVAASVTVPNDFAF